jgi:membrane-bound lytic murein transglycosylase A
MSEPAADLEPVDFAALPGWAAAEHGAALAAFRRQAVVWGEAGPKTRGLGIDGVALAAAGRAALETVAVDDAAARAFFETRFAPARVVPRAGSPFLTGYYEPELDGSRRSSARFRVPLLARPDDLVDVDDTNRPPGLDPSYAFARRTADGDLVAYLDRGEIEDGALAGRGLELVFLEDPVDAFFVHVQGSARVRLDDGSVMRLAYAAKAGHPYTSIAKVLIARGLATADEMTADVLRVWLKANPTEATALMRTNRSYVFFAEQPDLDPDLGAVAAAKVQLTPRVSLAVDRTLHTFGTPIFVDAALPLGEGGEAEPFRRLMIAQDTGSAIVGPARGDVFVGLGETAGRLAGRIRHVPAEFVVLIPRGGEGGP